MKIRILVIAAMLLVLLLSACTINRPVSATSNPLGQKVGVYTQTGFLGFPPPANNVAATAKAAQNGGITKISTVDQNTTWMFFIIKYQTIVTGE
ncbi:MAG: TRL domain-containing protein [Candidatus Cloacimonetes bacterium]|nr:TRL-like family protein [Candidatus Cloacimonadota bacterium]MDD2543139.1 TRL domain-containing protein [Candidatus Cloacimonadota bacterium]MDD3097060.1 TRL domain-containing protein [Candidatus Cloacimonadota bacterium]MDD4033966.1 TRL domain-containing protein [Candidatus Cloacimonadota bacterium]